MTQDNRLAFLDALKAIASQLIVLHHLAFYGPMADYAQPLAPDVFGWLAQHARIAVQAFLVMGGFLAAQSLARDGYFTDKPLPTLLWRRYLKLVLPYLGALVLAVLAAALARALMAHDSISDLPTLPQLLAHAFLLHGVLGFDGLSAGAWYVAIDFQLYTLFACTLWCARRRDLATPTAAIVLTTGLVAASLLYFNRDAGWDNWAVYFIGAYGLGALSFWCVKPGKISPWFLFALALTVTALCVDFRSRIALALAIAICLAATRFQPRLAAWPQSRLLAWLGKISYAVFLVHFPVCMVINAVFERFVPHTPGIQLFGVVLAWLSSTAAGALFFRHIEQRAQARLAARQIQLQA